MEELLLLIVVQLSKINGNSGSCKRRYQFSKIKPFKVKHMFIYLESFIKRVICIQNPINSQSDLPTMELVNDVRAAFFNWEVLLLGHGEAKWPLI